jgi:hypothetical protein
MPYVEDRALEDALYGQGLTPTQIFAVMLPVWQVEVQATVTDGRPYELIDRFLEKAIASGGLSTVAELSRFFALDAALVDRAVRFLAAIGHLVTRDSHIALTELGRRSVRDGVCYLVTRQDRRKLYFDAFHSQPLSRRYYDPGVVTLLPLEQVSSAAASHGRTFLKLSPVRGFRREALAELAGHPDRDHFNLPARIDQPESLGEELVYLPAYVVRAVDPGGRVTYQAYTQVGDTADHEISDLCRRTPEVTAVLNNEHLAARPQQQEARIKKWLGGQNLESCGPQRALHGTWRVVLPGQAFQPVGSVPLWKLGSFVVLGQDPVHVWCEDTTTRQRALLDRVDGYAGARSVSKATDVQSRIERMAVQLGFRSLDLAGIQRMAAADGRHGLSDRLAELTGTGDARRGTNTVDKSQSL